jgi:thermitase
MNAMKRASSGLLLVVCAGSALAADSVPAPVVTTVNAPDVIGGYASTSVMLQLRPGVEPSAINGKVTLADGNGPSAALAAVLARFGATAIVPTFDPPPANKELAAKLGMDRAFRVLVPEGTDTPALRLAIEQFSGLVRLSELTGIAGVLLTPNDSRYPECYGQNNTGQTGGTPDADIDAPEAWNLTTGSSSIKVAVLDTGIDATHPDLAGKVSLGFNWSSATTTDWADRYGHGTHCAGTISANGNNSIGVVGVAWQANLIAGKVLGDGGGGQWPWVASGITWAADQDARVISMSLGGGAADTAVQQACDYAWAQGSVIVCAAGNNNGGSVIYPARFPVTIAVSATDHNDVRASFSSRGPEVDVSAPGANVLSTYFGDYGLLSGTSMATPHVAGVMALIFARNPSLTNAQAREILETTVDDKGPAGLDPDYGWGRVNAFAAVSAATTCEADYNGDNQVDFFDYLDFADDFNSEAPAADFNGDNQIDFFDYLDFANVFAAGCD